MNLYAAGFNAWRQLQFSPTDNSANEPDDIASFQKVLSDDLIEVQHASLTCSIIKTSTGLRSAGFIDQDIDLELRHKQLSSLAAVMGNGTVAVYDGHGTITQYDSLRQFSKTRGGPEFTGMYHIVQLAACETSFVALSKDGKVYTWGDERYAAVLGRDITISSPAEKPGLMEDLEDLPSGRICRIAACGYTALALTEGRDLYAWGGHPARRSILETLSASPGPVDVDGSDILDFSVGESHIIVFTTGGDVYTIGDNTNGQLGLPSEGNAKWQKISMPPQGEDIVGVKAGQRSSFIVTRNSRLT